MNKVEAYDQINKVKNVSSETVDKLLIFHDLLIYWQKSINLVANSTVNDAWMRHFVDSCFISNAIGNTVSFVDMGSGAGFPGLVQALFMAERGTGKVNLIESNGKKCAFLNSVIRETGVKTSGLEITIHNDRVERILPKLGVPEVISARALTSLSNLLKLSEVPLTNGARAVFPKGREHLAELEVAKHIWSFDSKCSSTNLSDGSVIYEISNLSRL